MSENSRIRVAKDKAQLVKDLTALDGNTGPFQTFADVVIFAAALGAKHQKRVPLGEISKREPSPIRLESFGSMGTDIVIKLLAVTDTEEIKLLSPREEEDEKQRNEIFEEYANGGLEILQKELIGAVDYTEHILLLLSYEKTNNQEEGQEFDLSKFLS